MSWNWPGPGRSPLVASGIPRWRNRPQRTRRPAAIRNGFQVITITLSHTKRTLIHPNKMTTLTIPQTLKNRAIEGVCVRVCVYVPVG